MGGSDRYFKFERFWRCYEQLCIWHKYHGVINGRPNDTDSIAEMRDFIVRHPAAMVASTREASTLTYDDLKEKFFWRHYINNAFPESAKSHAFERYKNFFVRNYTDTRIMQLHQSLLPLRENCLRYYGFLADVQAHINHYIDPVHQCTKNEEIVTFLCGRYSFFLRNKMFHGEVADYTFRFYSKIKEDQSVDILNKLLQAAGEDMVLVFDTL